MGFLDRLIRRDVNGPSPSGPAADLVALLDAGPWAGLDPVRRSELRAAVLGPGHLPSAELWSGGGVWGADGEDLADGGVEPWLDLMAPALAECGVDLTVRTVGDPFADGSTGYVVALNGTPLELYPLDPAEPGVPQSLDPWLECTVRPMRAVNDLLAAAGADARLVAIGPGANDGLVLLVPGSMTGIDGVVS